MANMIIVLPDGIVVNAKSEKVKSETTIQKPAIIQKTEDGKIVKSKRKTDSGQVFNSFSYIDMIEVEKEVKDDEGNIVGIVTVEEELQKGTKLKDYAVNPDTGELELVKPFTRTLQVKLDYAKTLPLTYASKLLEESKYEVFGATDVDTIALCKALDEAIEKDVMFVVENFVWREGYSAYHAILIPDRDPTDGTYSLIMMTTTGRALYTHKMKPQMEVKEVAKEVKVLPSLLNTLIGG